ncbi:GDSL-type esterase/lipase family protein [Stenotrophomonas sp. UBA7606]|uniref:GDSL-type esterase/lipase family protein n=1 Tax=Stenotrophomonas sp. UBA7606 TaxID=1947559 RepID=UPI0025EAE4B5|nr:GDSL-type esterase/lipase family protein [Stenotrophomonas sp. UBA7606]
MSTIEKIAERDLPVSAAGAADFVRVVKGGKSFLSLASDLPVPAAVPLLIEDSEQFLQGKIAEASAASAAADSVLSQKIDDVEAIRSSGMMGFDSLANLNADLAHVAGSLAVVTNDASSSNNGTYRKLGASGSGSWIKAVTAPLTDGAVTETKLAAAAVTGSKLAVNSVTASKLSGGYNYKASLSSGSVNSVVAAGRYLVSGSVADLPAGAPTSRMLIVTSLNSDSYVLQEYFGLTGQTSVWRRSIRPNNGPTYNPWVVQNAYRSALSSGSANDVVTDGRYLVTAAMADLPVGAPASGYLEVSVHASWVMQEYSSLQTPDVAWRRTLRTDTGVFYPWAPTKSAGISPLQGKKVAFFGDSITENGDYPERVAARLGCVPLKFGFGGCRMGLHNNTASGILYGKMSMWKLADYVSSGDYSELTTAAQDLFTLEGDDNRPQAAALAATDWATVDYVVIAFGTNDWGGDNPLGANGDTTAATFKGAINYTITKLMTAYPHLKVAFVSPMWRSRRSAGDGLESDANPNTNGTFLLEFADAVREVAALRHLPALDLYRTAGINQYNGSIYLADGLHPVAGVGFQRLADRVGAFLGSVF